jgi:TonB family protein
MIVPKMPTRGQPLQVPIGLFPTYCFDPSLPVVVAKSSFGALQVVYEKSVRVQNRILPNSLSEYEGRDKVLSASVESIEALSPTDPALIPPQEAMKPAVERVQLSAGLVAGRRTGGIVPIYPADAKAVRAQGTVVLRAVIGRDGRIHDLKVMSAPYPSLVQSAMWAVSHWTYKPYLLNGQPVEIDTQINVTYRLGG